MWHLIGDHEEHAFIGSKIQAVIDTIVDHYNLIAHQLAKPGLCAALDADRRGRGAHRRRGGRLLRSG
jgi:hypothetical protein